MAANFYRQHDSPRYALGHGLELGFIGCGIIAACILLGGYASINRSRQLRMQQGEHRTYTGEQLSAMGDKAITFRYMY